MIEEHAREILATLAPEIDAEEITLDADLDQMGLDRVTRFGLGVGLERALKIELSDATIMNAATLADMVGGADDSPTTD